MKVIEEPLIYKAPGVNNSNATDLPSEQNATTIDNEQLAREELGLVEEATVFKSIRQTNLRWLMLTFGCVFLMGSYFCYDIPGVAQPTFQLPPYNLQPFQVQMMYIVYSTPNTILPLLGGIFLDKIGIR